MTHELCQIVHCMTCLFACAEQNKFDLRNLILASTVEEVEQVPAPQIVLARGTF